MSLNLRGLLNRFGLFTRAQMEQKRNQPAFAAAAINRLTNDWATSTLSADAKTRNSLQTLRARSRIVADDDRYGKKFTTMLKTDVLGECGITLRNKAKDPDRVVGGKMVPGALDIFANTQIQDAWWEWGKKENCTVTKEMCWSAVQEQVLQTIAIDGECLIRKVRHFDNPFQFALQVLESDYLDIHKNEKLPNGHVIRMGVELNTWRQPVAYHLFAENPNDNYFGTYSAGQRYLRVPASDLIHLFVRDRSEQSRGIPWMSAGMKALNMLDGYEEAVLVNKRVSACKMGFLETTGDAEYKGEDDGRGNKFMDAEPGAFEQLPQGLKLASWTPQDTDPNTAMFIKANLRGIAAAFGVSYNVLADDMESVNFASGQLSLGFYRDTMRRVQRFIIDNFLNEVFKDWLDTQFVMGIGRIGQLPYAKFAKFNAPEWRGRRWQPVNPQQYYASVKDRLAMRLTSVSRVLQEEGEDPDETFQEIAEDKKKMETLDILPTEIFPPDPSEMLEEPAAVPAA